MKTYVVDTHALVWYLSRDIRLSKTAYAVMHDPEARLVISVIVLAEVKHLGQKGRVVQTLEKVLQVIGTDPRCVVYPVDLDVVSRMPLELDIHDALIVGTALAQSEAVEGILTRDKKIQASNLVPTIW